MKLAFALCATLLSSTLLAAQNPLQQAIDGDHRIAEHKARDIYRHPAETLEFFQIKPGQTVVEITPGSWQWYTEILAPYVGSKGTLYAASPRTGVSRPSAQMLAQMTDEQKARLAKTPQKLPIVAKFERHPSIFANTRLVKFNSGENILDVPAGSADRVLTFRNVHNWMGKPGSAETAFVLFYKALKPGGMLGVVEHRASEGTSREKTLQSGYVTTEQVIKYARDAGFELAASSEVNANPKDSKDYQRGVWALPPRLWANDGNNEKYKAIGESDRMTLLFKKP